MPLTIYSHSGRVPLSAQRALRRGAATARVVAVKRSPRPNAPEMPPIAKARDHT